ncbi:hypothetical protein J5N97_003211 [Dioscorea zingiberensis]|uniref:Myb/SANT-like domain-containing protein n=1 Tax=Dioscorea zingiberensis TaxID=325984 RepID=A0A9D5HPV4_9LILI|nr:hypothetical protein J5N97_003211 [Dioscorea zingiberensis]
MSSLGKRPMSAETGSSPEVSKRKGKGTPNRRWTKDMDDILIPCLANMARAGLKVDKSFKRQAFVDVAIVINTRFPDQTMDATNVENHMRSLKTRDDQATGQFSRSIYEQFGAPENEGINDINAETENMDTTPVESGSQPQETLAHVL